jgi:hypothetical protein
LAAQKAVDIIYWVEKINGSETFNNALLFPSHCIPKSPISQQHTPFYLWFGLFLCATP